MEQQQKNILERANEWLDSTFSPNGKKLFLAILVFMIVACVVFGISFFRNKNTANNVEKANINNDAQSEIMVEDNVEEVDIEIEDSGDKMVSILVEDVGRADPFLPEHESDLALRNTSVYGYSLMAPPGSLSEDAEATQVVSTKVSGILYDSSKPSAILNIEGSDYVVRTGDYINNYKVLSISKDLVTVQLGNNVYKAGVGQAMTDDGTINYNNVYDLQNRFGGAKR